MQKDLSWEERLADYLIGGGGSARTRMADNFFLFVTHCLFSEKKPVRMRRNIIMA